MLPFLYTSGPNLLAPGTSFGEDNFYRDRCGEKYFGMIRAHSSQAHLLLCSPLPKGLMGTAWRLVTPALHLTTTSAGLYSSAITVAEKPARHRVYLRSS